MRAYLLPYSEVNKYLKNVPKSGFSARKRIRIFHNSYCISIAGMLQYQERQETKEAGLEDEPCFVCLFLFIKMAGNIDEQKIYGTI